MKTYTKHQKLVSTKSNNSAKKPNYFRKSIMLLDVSGIAMGIMKYQTVFFISLK